MACAAALGGVLWWLSSLQTKKALSASAPAPPPLIDPLLQEPNGTTTALVASGDMPRLSLIGSADAAAASRHNTAKHVAKAAIAPEDPGQQHAPVSATQVVAAVPGQQHAPVSATQVVAAVPGQQHSPVSAAKAATADPTQQHAQVSAAEAVTAAVGAAAGVAAAAVPGQGSSTTAVIPKSRAEMHDCSNDDSGLPLPKLKVEQRWTSAGAREIWDVTLVTQLSPSRQQALTKLCRNWGSVIAAAVYVPLVDGRPVVEPRAADAAQAPSLAQVAESLAAFHGSMEQLGTCKLDMVLYSEEVRSPAQSALYPVNSLRNAALEQALTEVVLLDDVDFIVSPGVVGPQQYEAIVQRTRARQALVLPALEPYEEVVGIEKGIQQTVQALAGGKAEAAAMLSRKELKPFHVERWDLAHRAADYPRWATADAFYDIVYEHDFEPYVLVAKKDVPPYDERLRGYFENKAVHIRHMAAGGVTFAVHPTAFVVHLPHPPSAARQWIIDPANQATRDLIQGLGTVMREWIDAGTYAPLTAAACTEQQQMAAAVRFQQKVSAKAAVQQQQVAQPRAAGVADGAGQGAAAAAAAQPGAQSGQGADSAGIPATQQQAGAANAAQEAAQTAALAASETAADVQQAGQDGTPQAGKDASLAGAQTAVPLTALRESTLGTNIAAARQADAGTEKFEEW